MERSSFCKNWKQHTINNSSRNLKNLQDHKVKGSSWDFHSECTNNVGEQGDLMAAGFSWPPRSYTCSFCKREFRSAQALGGHMNVHRRDRARLRQSPPRDDCYSNTNGQFPMLNLNLGPNPSLNSNPSSSPSAPPAPLSSHCTKFPLFTSTMSPIFTPSLSSLSSNANKMKKWEKDTDRPIQGIRPLTTNFVKINARKGLSRVEKLDGFVHDKGFDVVKKAEESVRLDLEIGLISQNKEELDLELRLGYV